MTQNAKSAERDRLAAALRANLRRRKTATRPAEIGAEHREQAANRAPAPAHPDAAADHESKG